MTLNPHYSREYPMSNIDSEHYSHFAEYIHKKYGHNPAKLRQERGSPESKTDIGEPDSEELEDYNPDDDLSITKDRLFHL